jgi:hypothetical protein
MMALTLAAFIQELYQGATDPTSGIYLPVVLLEQVAPVDPLGPVDAVLGDLGALDPGLPSELCAAVSSGTIAQPPTAVMSVSGLELIGLGYSLPAQPTVSGQQVSVAIELAAAPAVNGMPPPQPLQFAGAFSIALSCCPSADGKTCSGATQPTPVTGTVTVTFTGATAAFTLTFASDFSVVVDSIVFAAQGVTTAFQVATPTDQGPALSSLLNTALATPAANAAIIAAVNMALSRRPLLATLGSALTPVSQSLAYPSLLSFIVSKLYKAAIDPSSAEYMPKVISSASKPTLEPYSVQGGWNLGDVSGDFPSAGYIICAGMSTMEQSDIATPNSPVLLDLTNIQIAGMSNALPLPMLTVGDTIEAMAVIGQVAGWPHQFTITGDFMLQVSCCPTEDFATCSGPSQVYVGSGTFSGVFTAAAVAASITLSAPDNKLLATVNGLNLRTDPNAINPQNLNITVDITSIPAGDRCKWNKQTENLFNSPQAAAALVGNIQQQMNGAGVLQALSGLVTTAINNLLHPAERAEVAAHLTALAERSLLAAETAS